MVAKGSESRMPAAAVPLACSGYEQSALLGTTSLKLRYPQARCPSLMQLSQALYTCCVQEKRVFLGGRSWWRWDLWFGAGWGVAFWTDRSCPVFSQATPNAQRLPCLYHVSCLAPGNPPLLTLTQQKNLVFCWGNKCFWFWFSGIFLWDPFRWRLLMHLCIFIWYSEYMPETELGSSMNTQRPGLHQTEIQYKCM